LNTAVVRLARRLLGKYLVTRIRGRLCSGMIIETEAYRAYADRANHASGGRRTLRNAAMFGPGGQAYVYLCYGMHNLFNVVTNQAGTAEAVLIRALEPADGIATMQKRRRRRVTAACVPRKKLCAGPGTLTQALAITRALNQADLRGNKIWIEDRGVKLRPAEIRSGPRVGVEYAGEDAKLPFRFWIAPRPHPNPPR
jgi:DNA-3-methyladenine glycosylase